MKKKVYWTSSHPITGSEVSGPEHGREDLFENKWCVLIKDKKTIYNLKVDSKMNKFNEQNQLQKIDLNLLPSYIIKNKKLFKEWIEE